MDLALESAKKFLTDKIQLEKVELKTISSEIYEASRLEGCDIFRFSLYKEAHIGSAQYIAIPKDSSTPIYLGQLGE